MQGYSTLIPTSLYTPVGVISTVIGFLLTLGFFIYQFTYKKLQRSINLQFILALLASLFSTVGIFLLALSMGIYF